MHEATNFRGSSVDNALKVTRRLSPPPSTGTGGSKAWRYVLSCFAFFPYALSWHTASSGFSATASCKISRTSAESEVLIYVRGCVRARARGTPDVDVTAVTSSGHVTSWVTLQIDSDWPLSYRLPIVNNPLSPVVFEIFNVKYGHRHARRARTRSWERRSLPNATQVHTSSPTTAGKK